ncbi:MAG: insulinase family protein [bacterium]|nr:insulinase family protein [bacterium]
MNEPLDRSHPPAPEPARGFEFPACEHRRLSSGVAVLRLAVDGMPMIHLRLLLAAGGHHAPADSPGLPSLTAALLDEGTSRRTGTELAAEIERLGGYLATGTGWDSTVIETEVLEKDFETGMALLAEVAREPSFPDHEVGRVRRQLQAEVKRREAQPSSVAGMRFERSLYAGTVYDTPLIGTHDSLERLDRDAVVDFYSRHVTPAGATLVAVGNVTSERLIEQAEAAFAGWSGGPISRPRIEAVAQQALRLEIVDRPGAAQTEIRVGHVGIDRAHPRYLEAAVLSCLLGGKFTSRLNLNLREQRGFTYGVRSSFGKRSGPAPFVISTALANEHVGEALDEIFGELGRLLDEAPRDEEVADTRDYLIGSFPYTVETLRGLAGRLSDLAVYDLPDDYYAKYPRALAAISGEQLLETARELLTPDRALVVCVGPATELQAQLEDRFEVPVSVIRSADSGSSA